MTEREPGSSASAPALRVQVIEDLPRVQALLRELIEESGRFQVTAVSDSEDEALRQFDALRPDAVVVDLALRAGSGLGVIHGIRSRNTGAQPLVIVLTNHALPVIEAACRRAGADHFLDKSRDFHKVHGLLEHAARRPSH